MSALNKRERELVPRTYLKSTSHFLFTNAFPLGIKVAAYPMERIRLLMQTQHTNTSIKGGSVSSLMRTMTHIQSEGSITSPWRGVTPTLVRWLPSQYLILFIKDFLSNSLPSYSKEDSYGKYITSKVGSGAATGIITALVWAYPLDVMRQQLAIKSSGTLTTTAKQIYSAYGFKGFYRGFLIDSPGLMIFRGVQLGGWDLLKDFYGKSWDEKTRRSRFIHGQVISLMGSFCSYPYDTIRRNLISLEGSNSYREVLRAGILNSGGIRAFFYAGFSARILSSFVNGGLLEGFDEWKKTR